MNRLVGWSTVEPTLSQGQLIMEFSGDYFDAVDVSAEAVEHSLEQSRCFGVLCSPQRVGTNTGNSSKNGISRCSNNANVTVPKSLNSSPNEDSDRCGAHILFATPRLLVCQPFCKVLFIVMLLCFNEIGRAKTRTHRCQRQTHRIHNVSVAQQIAARRLRYPNHNTLHEGAKHLSKMFIVRLHNDKYSGGSSRYGSKGHVR